jgi:hypothetical protein
MTPSTDTRVSALLQLAERCEKAAGPDRKLDVAIYKAIPELLLEVPAYTASLDAAMQLVPEDFRWWFSCGNIRPTGEPPEVQQAFAKVWQSTTAEHDLWRGDGATTPALALCAAALRARAAS